MPRWMRVIRGMIGTGLTFAVGVGVVGSMLGGVGLLAGELSAQELARMVAKTSVVAFLVGMIFSGVLAITARGRSFDKLSFRFVTALGAGGGLLYFLFLAAANGARVWSAADAIANFAILIVIGGGLAAGTLLLARRARHALKPGDELRSLGEGGIEAPLSQREADQTSRL